MDRNLAVKIIQDSFQTAFKGEKFVRLVKDLLNHVEDSPFVYRGNYIPDAFKPYVSTLERVGKYEDTEGNKVDVLIVYLKKETSLERARTMQRNFIAWYLNGSRGDVCKEAALVAFVSPGQDDWRFSLVKMEYTFNEKGKVEEEFTPARRYSFLVGKNESSHTAQSQLLPILLDDEHNPLLKELEDAFSIEKVTKEFFEEYRDLFLNLKETLDEIVKKDGRIKKDFEEKGVDTVDFAKKLLGQVVFLYFLQKKGWFGVERDADWGTGPKNFLRLLFEKKVANYNNFFNDILEPLFYEALAIERPDDFYSRFNCKIPFLNGGLFDPINNYDWVHTDILLPNELFSNTEKTKEGDIGKGILDVFDRYNFTVKEDEPLEKEVAVDPEMLGKVFENLLEVKDRKSKGTYYTPREIVHYMCQESLVNYLATELSSVIARSQATKQSLPTKEDIEMLVKYGETAVEHDAMYIEKLLENPDYKGKYDKPKLPRILEKNSQFIDEKLASIRVCDPAVGSGAFLVGMMSEIIRTRDALTPYIENRHSELSEESRAIYDFKRHAIQNCLYGVDIDPGAIEIAKLRLWLSLVVDEEDIKQIKPLPNLDYKIVCGNSLLGVEKNLLNLDLFNKLEELKPIYFNETSVKKKQEYKAQIDELISEITNGHKDFDFEVYFSEVFHDLPVEASAQAGKKGFDVVIGNPPYVEHKKLKELSPVFRSLFETYSGTTDLYVYFYEKGINILKHKGVLTYISSNKFIKTSYGAKLRSLLTKHHISQIIDFSKIHVFDALVASCILVVINESNNKEIIVSFADDRIRDYPDLNDFISKYHISIAAQTLSDSIWQLEDNKKVDLKKKIELGSEKLIALNGVHIYRGVTTGSNEAFVINDNNRKQLLHIDPRSKDIIKPLLQGRNIKKWIYTKAGTFLLQTGYDLDIQNNYPAVFQHLTQFKEKLVTRADQGKRWWNLRACAYYSEFEKEKIVWGLTADKWAFAYDDKKYYLPSNAYLLTSSKTHLKYILALLNSNLMKFYFGFIGIMTAGGAFTLKHETIGELPVKKIPYNEQEPLINRVNRILAITKDEDYLTNHTKQAKVKEYESQIDQMVYKLYGLTPEEIKIVENGLKKE